MTELDRNEKFVRRLNVLKKIGDNFKCLVLNLLPKWSVTLKMTANDEEFVEVRDRSISLSSQQRQESNNERRWRLSYLKDQFETLELQKLFNRYIQRINHGYFSQFLSLQIISITVHFIILITTVEANYRDDPDFGLNSIKPDLILYGSMSLFSIALLIITDTYVKTHPKLLKYLAGIAFLTIFFINFFIPLYKLQHLRPAYTTYLIISNYIFLNVHNNQVALVLGLFVSIFHLVVLILVTYDDKGKLAERLGSDGIFLASINGLGMYFRYMNEIVIRRSFLDRRSCIESTHQLKFEEEQENNLMSSLIPQHIIAKVRSTLNDYIDHYEKASCISTQKPFNDLYVEEIPNVSILFADIVNYTAMTTKLSVTELLDILNELFGRFDDASEELQVLRIKFLGDCYYCVAGLPPKPAPHHAQACVDLGLKMIGIIADIRKRKNLDINMRIGIHSGKINCGIIGTIKWQYDIWSVDVDTANKMETEGTPGMVHITSETKNLLRKSYNFIRTNKIVNHKRTYLIAPPPETNPNKISLTVTDNKPEKVNEEPKKSNENQRRSTIYIKRTNTAPNEIRLSNTITQNIRSYSLDKSLEVNGGVKEDKDEKTVPPLEKRHTFPNSNNSRRFSGNIFSIFARRPSGNVRLSTERRLTGNDRKRRTAFMNNNIKRYKERLEETNKELEETIETMLLSKFEQWFKVSDMYRILLVFKDRKIESDFLKMPDPLFKYYLLCVLLLLSLVYILENLTLSRWDWPHWPYYFTLGTVIFILLPLTWTHYLWSKYIAKFEHDIPSNKLILFLYNSSKTITNNSFIRFFIYTCVCMMFCLCVLTEWVDCYIEVNNPKNETYVRKNFLALIMERGYSFSEDTAECSIPWHMTETCGVAIITTFIFLRMYMWLKLFYASVIVVIYALCVFTFSGTFYGDSQTYNYLLQPQISHVISVFFLTAVLHFVDRQTEYMHRIDHLWYKNLLEKEQQANKVQKVNNILLQNILPIHVAELYLNLNRSFSEDVYNETYEDAAVMFASITNFSIEAMGDKFLKTMSTIISEFDMLLVGNTFGRPIEKIKIAKWTYMAACGLAPGVGDIDNMRKDSKNHVVICLLKFAVSLIKKLNSLNTDNFQNMKLRIGISHGYIAAGVVGSKKPIYDIWGDPVNMASRMDTTGFPDNIQVLKPTAEIIECFGYKCRFRGNIKVKGREGLVPTYLVELDDDFNLVKKNK